VRQETTALLEIYEEAIGLAVKVNNIGLLCPFLFVLARIRTKFIGFRQIGYDCKERLFANRGYYCSSSRTFCTCVCLLCSTGCGLRLENEGCVCILITTGDMEGSLRMFQTGDRATRKAAVDFPLRLHYRTLILHSLAVLMQR